MTVLAGSQLGLFPVDGALVRGRGEHLLYQRGAPSGDFFITVIIAYRIFGGAGNVPRLRDLQRLMPLRTRTREVREPSSISPRIPAGLPEAMVAGCLFHGR